MRIIAGTRGSRLALIQTEIVLNQLKQIDPDLKTVVNVINTKGDLILDKPLGEIKGKGLFTKELEKALYDKSIDFAVHSLKDLPVQLPPGLMIGAYLEHCRANDVLISKKNLTLDQIKKNGTIATGSLRRRRQLQRIRPDLNIAAIRGNIDTRIKKFQQVDWDGIILAYAALARLDYLDKISQVLDQNTMYPAAGQGIIVVECRSDDQKMLSLLQGVNHFMTEKMALAQRSLLENIGGGCQVPLGCSCEVSQDRINLKAIYMPQIDINDQFYTIEKEARGSLADCEIIGRKLAQQLLRAKDNYDRTKT